MSKSLREANPLQSAPTVADAVAHLAQRAEAGHFDELRGRLDRGEATPDALTPQWTRFFNTLGSTGIGELDRKTRELERQVFDNGITYNVYAEEVSDQRPWALDLLPVMISPADWQAIAIGVLQRADLCERIMADIYGPQRLLKESMLPSALVQGHPGYLRPMHGIAQEIDRPFFQVVAFDLARNPTGEWAVLSQRVQAPSGLGYMLENRLLISSHFPSAFAALDVAPMAESYQAMLTGLKALAPAGSEGHIALLTPGPYNETYFEQVYLAKALGLTLVEGSDLTVRDRRLYLRNLRGLEPVDVLLKRLDDPFLDPLELRSDSTLGVPGLLQAIRAGHVRMANMPGAGFLESPALLGFLPAISEMLLGERLKLPAMDTWWCGEAAAYQDAVPRLGELVLKPTYPLVPGRAGFDTRLGRTLSEAQSRSLLERIAATPAAATLQAYVPLSQTPVWQALGASGSVRIATRSFLLRVFAVRLSSGAWQVLPGGLARLAGSREPEIASMQRGGSSADVWVCGVPQARVAPGDTLANASVQVEITPKVNHGAWHVTSRSAENLFWYGRYAERSENSVRLAKLCLESLSGETPRTRQYWQWIEAQVLRDGLVPDGTTVRAGQAAESVGLHVLADTQGMRVFERTLIGGLDHSENTTSVGYNLRAMQRAASVVRERLSSEQWLVVKGCVEGFSQDMALAAGPRDYSSVQAMQALGRVSGSLAAIAGAQLDRMTHDEGWHLLCMGRYIERLSWLAEVMGAAFEGEAFDHLPQDDACFTGLLFLFDSSITFRARYQQVRDIRALWQLLVLDRSNPRAMAWMVDRLRTQWQAFSQAIGDDSQGEAELSELIGQMQHLLQAEWTLLSASAQSGARARALLSLRDAAWQLSDRLNSRFFSHGRSAETTIGA